MKIALSLLSTFLIGWALLLADGSTPGGRATYESLTAPRGTFLLRQQEREKALKNTSETSKEKNKSDSSKTTVPSAQTKAKPYIADESQGTYTPTSTEGMEQGPIINFNNVSISEILKYISRLTGKNFIYDPNELQFNITMISETPTSMEDLMAMVLQSLQIHGYLVNEQDNGFIIHANPAVKSVAELQPNKMSIDGPQITTQVFALQNTASDKCAAIIKAMASDNAIVDTVSDSKIIVSDIAENIARIEELVKKLDLGTNDLDIGQYVAVNSSPYALAMLVDRIMAPLANNKTLVLVPHSGSNSIYIISTPYLVEKTLGIAQMVDLGYQKSGLLSDEYKFDPELQEDALKKAYEKLQKGGLTQLEQLSREDIDNMPIEEVQAELMKRGYTLEEVLALPPDMARSLLWQLLSAEREAKERASSQTVEIGDENLPFGRSESTHFYIHKLQFRKSSDVANALHAIANSMIAASSPQQSDKTSTNAPTPAPDLMQADLLMTLNSLQPLEDNNSIVFTGTRASIAKIKELISQIDLPVRQVFIEALVLNTNLSDSLNFGVEWGIKAMNNNFGASFGFINPTNSNFGPAFNAVNMTPGSYSPPTPAAATFNPAYLNPTLPGGLSAGSIGRKIKFNGHGFRSIGALVTAVQSNNEMHVMLNPKITVEHNVPAEIFVGSQTPIKGQSIANSTSSSTSAIVATNYNTVNVGVSLKVTPLISSKDTVTLIIEQKISNADNDQVAAQGQTTAPPATINEIRSTTRVHLPTDHFLVMSGMIQEQLTVKKDQIPCLGALPLIGSLFGNKVDSTSNKNIMLFIRPIILDNEVDIDEITQRQDKAAKEKSQVFQGWNKQVDTAKMILNLEQQ